MDSTAPFFCLLIKNTWQKLSRYYNQQLSQADLSVQKGLLLLELPSGIGKHPRTLANNLNLENSSITGLLDRLEKQGLIKRQPDPSDRRSVLVFLTATGVEARNAIKASVETLDNQLQTMLSPEEIKIFRKVIATINKQIN